MPATDIAFQDISFSLLHHPDLWQFFFYGNSCCMSGKCYRFSSITNIFYGALIISG